MSDFVQPHRRQPTRLPRPWDSPGKNTGVGCHFLIQCMKVKSESEVAQSCPTLSNPMDCSLPGSSAYGIFQARVLEWGVIAFSGWSLKGPEKKKNSKWKSPREEGIQKTKEIDINNKIRKGSEPPITQDILGLIETSLTILGFLPASL